MASLGIFDENITQIRGKDGLQTRQRRPVLGLVNTNIENNIIRPQVDNGVLKGKLTTKAGAASKNVNCGKAGPSRAPACQPFAIFQDEPDAELNRHTSAMQPLNNHIKARALKEKKVDDVIENISQPAVSTHADYLQACLGAAHAAPVPMSPPSDIDEESPMDVSLKKPEERSRSIEAEAAQRELDSINLTEKLYNCEEYRLDILLYLKSLQTCFTPRKNYMSRQPEITYHMRAVLIDWLVEVTDEYSLTNDTLYLAVQFIDRFLSCMSVVKGKLQLVGTAAMFIAAKYEEIYPPDVKDFVFITDDTYTKRQVLRMEHLILRVLEFHLSVPTALTFLTDYTSNFPTPDNIKYLAMYLCELSLLQGDPYLGMLPSEIAAAALCVARVTLLPEEEVMPEELMDMLDVQLLDIIYVVEALETTYRNAETSPQQATREKYKLAKYLKVACVPPPITDCSSILSKSLTPTPERPPASKPSALATLLTSNLKPSVYRSKP